MNNTLTAQELKTKGAQILNKKTKKFKEVVLTVRGKETYVILTMGQYNHLRECELEAALAESERDLAQGKYSIKSVARHMSDLKHA